MNHPDLPVILHNEKRGLLTVEDGKLDVIQLSRDGRPPKLLLSCPIRNFLLARLAHSTLPNQRRRLDLHALIQKGNELRLSKLHVLVEQVNAGGAEEWVKMIMVKAYVGSKPFRKVLLLVNPTAGKGKGRAITKEITLPILEAAGCIVELRETTHRLHAEEMMRDIEIVYEVIATSSGDGLVSEVINGLAARPDARRALKTPIAPIPTGSANALCINLFGPKDTFNIPLACLTVIKGEHIIHWSLINLIDYTPWLVRLLMNTGQLMPLDLTSVTLLPSMQRKFSFLAIALGLMVDLDIGTESMRWIGDSRFLLGFVRGLVSNKNFKCRLEMQVVEHDKVEMARRARKLARELQGRELFGKGHDPLADKMSRLSVEGKGKSRDARTDQADETASLEDADPDPNQAQPLLPKDVADEPLPAVKRLEPDDTWKTIETTRTTSNQEKRNSVGPLKSRETENTWHDGDGMLYLYAGLMPWVARDLNQWPVAMSGDGLIDLVVQGIVARPTLVNAITSADKGEAFWQPSQYYYKAFRCENLDPERQKLFTIDGEAYPFEAFEVEVFPRLANVLSLDGHFVSEFLHKHELHE